jgi:hypothetical protein
MSSYVSMEGRENAEMMIPEVLTRMQKEIK